MWECSEQNIRKYELFENLGTEMRENEHHLRIRGAENNWKTLPDMRDLI